MDLPKDIVHEILKILNPKDLFRYASTAKKAWNQTLYICQKRCIDQARSSIDDWRFWWRTYIREQRNTLICIFNTLYQVLLRYLNKKIGKKYIQPNVFESIYHLISAQPCLLDMKSIQYEKQEVEHLMLRHMDHGIAGIYIEKYFRILYKDQYAYLFDYHLDKLFDPTPP